jgi:16S rRNA (uracil1498-N3)-methyltransferase
MSLPFFFSENIEGNNLVLDEETSRHIVQVLRMENAEHLLLTDGKGTIAEGEISNANKKHCSIQILNRRF